MIKILRNNAKGLLALKKLKVEDFLNETGISQNVWYRFSTLKGYSINQKVLIEFCKFTGTAPGDVLTLE